MAQSCGFVAGVDDKAQAASFANQKPKRLTVRLGSIRGLLGFSRGAQKNQFQGSTVGSAGKAPISILGGFCLGLDVSSFWPGFCEGA